MKIPLANRLRKRMHTDIAMLQDEAVDIVYSIENSAVMHGGTAIWRCYGGNRFSEDLDFYIPKSADFGERLRAKLDERGLVVNKFKKTENLIFMKVSNGTVEIRAEFNFAVRKEGVAKSYEKADGSEITIFTLESEQLIVEKANAYRNRRFIRDIYDVFHLSSMIGRTAEVEKTIHDLINELPEPIDEKNLKTIVYSGAVPSFEQMVSQLKKRFS